MKVFNIVTLLVGLLTVQSVFAGKESGDRGGNGGIAYVCRDSKKNTITSARLLDLWEPITFETQLSNDQVSDQIKSALKNIKKAHYSYYHDDRYLSRFDDYIKNIVDYVIESMVLTDRVLALSNDALPNYTPEKNCNYEQLGRFNFFTDESKEKLLVNKEIWESAVFSNTDKAAFVIHEALYLIERLLINVEYSTFSRSLVASTFRLDSSYKVSGAYEAYISRFELDQEASFDPKIEILNTYLASHKYRAPYITYSNGKTAKVGVFNNVGPDAKDCAFEFHLNSGDGPVVDIIEIKKDTSREIVINTSGLIDGASLWIGTSCAQFIPKQNQHRIDTYKYVDASLGQAWKQITLKISLYRNTEWNPK